MFHRSPADCSENGRFADNGRAASLSFSEDDCTRQRGLKAVVQSSIGLLPCPLPDAGDGDGLAGAGIS